MSYLGRMFRSPAYWAAVGGGLGLYFLVLRPRKAQAMRGEDPRPLLRNLKAYLEGGGNFGWAGNRSPQVAEAQRAVQVVDDGIVGPITRAAIRKYGIELPLRPGTPKAGASPKEWEVTIGTATLVPAAREAGATEPEPAQVMATPKARKGSLVLKAGLQLKGLEATFADAKAVEDRVKKKLPDARTFSGGCRMAPKLRSTPSVRAVGHGKGRFDVTIRWPATWASGGVPAGLKPCLLAEARKIPELKKNMTSLQVRRS